MPTKGDQRFYFKYNETTKELIVEVTDKIAFKIMKMVREVLPIPMLSAKLEYVDVLTDGDFLYKNVRRYTILCESDECDIFFEAAKETLKENIAKSIGHSNN